MPPTYIFMSSNVKKLNCTRPPLIVSQTSCMNSDSAVSRLQQQHIIMRSSIASAKMALLVFGGIFTVALSSSLDAAYPECDSDHAFAIGDGYCDASEFVRLLLSVSRTPRYHRVKTSTVSRPYFVSNHHLIFPWVTKRHSGRMRQ